MPPKRRVFPSKKRVLPVQQAEPAAPRGTMRINRYLSMCGIASRRKAEDLVTQGKVSINGAVIHDLGHQVDPDGDKVVVEGRQVVRTHEFTYLVMNKPKDTITTLSDERGRPTVMALVRSKRRVYPIGRLDRNTTGVLLLTDDGDFANRLMHPRFEIPKSYLVSCAETVRREDLLHLARGIKLDDGVTAPAGVEVIGGTKGMDVGITIHEGRNRQVRRMFEELGYTVKRLERVAYGPVTAAGLPRGETRPMTHQEIRLLKRLAGMPAEE
jgi:23S rRNA pseudouridine2605 synthase